MFNTEYRYKKGYTLAEMLLVLVIFSLMMIALPPLTRKMFKVDSVTRAHGRFECYYNKNGNLIQYKIDENSQPEPPENRTANGKDYCEFVPPSNSIYTMIHAVGGGGAGYTLNTSDSDEQMSVKETEALSYLYYSVAGLWPEWFKYLLNNKGGLSFTGDKFETFKTFRYASLPYGLAGEAGEKISMFFPRLKGVTIRIKPGKGGVVASSSGAGTSGGSTTVDFKYADETNYTNAITAHGGAAGNVAGKYGAAITGGNATDYGVSELSAVKVGDSGFDTVIEDPGLSDSYETRINVTSGSIHGTDADWGGIHAGWGGNGDFYFLSSSAGTDYYGRFSYQVNNYSEIIKDSNTVERDNDWRLVTKYIKKNFYSRNGQKAKCEDTLESAPIKVKAWCSADKSDVNYLYKCKIDDIGKIQGGSYTNKEHEIRVTNAGEVESNPTGYTDCKLVEFKNYVVCTTSSNITNAYRKCQFDSNSAFECPYGVKSGNMCKASNGGNGAVIILW